MIHDREHHLDVLLLQVKSMEVTTAVVTSMLLTGNQNWSIILAGETPWGGQYRKVA